MTGAGEPADDGLALAVDGAGEREGGERAEELRDRRPRHDGHRQGQRGEGGDARGQRLPPAAEEDQGRQRRQRRGGRPVRAGAGQDRTTSTPASRTRKTSSAEVRSRFMAQTIGTDPADRASIARWIPSAKSPDLAVDAAGAGLPTFCGIPRPARASLDAKDVRHVPPSTARPAVRRRRHRLLVAGLAPDKAPTSSWSDARITPPGTRTTRQRPLAGRRPYLIAAAAPFLLLFTAVLRERLAAAGASAPRRSVLLGAGTAFAVTALVGAALYAARAGGAGVRQGARAERPTSAATCSAPPTARWSCSARSRRRCSPRRSASARCAAGRCRGGWRLAGIPLSVLMLANAVMPMAAITLWFAGRDHADGPAAGAVDVPGSACLDGGRRRLTPRTRSARTVRADRQRHADAR